MRTSPLLGAAGIVHGFGDRTVGVSAGVYARGNAGLAGGDDPQAVRTNRRLFAERLGREAGMLCTLKQVHGADALLIEAPEQGLRQGDALVTRVPGLLLAVTTADCVPVLLADPETRVVAAAHAGWRGAVAGIVEATLARMTAAGAAPERVRAALGPAIRQASYQVDPPFRDAVLARRPWATPLFEPDGAAHWRFDLPRLVRESLRRAGVTSVDDAGLDTLQKNAIYFSHRHSRQRDEVGYGVQLSGISLSF